MLCSHELQSCYNVLPLRAINNDSPIINFKSEAYRSKSPFFKLNVPKSRYDFNNNFIFFGPSDRAKCTFSCPPQNCVCNYIFKRNEAIKIRAETGTLALLFLVPQTACLSRTTQHHVVGLDNRLIWGIRKWRSFLKFGRLKESNQQSNNLQQKENQNPRAMGPAFSFPAPLHSFCWTWIKLKIKSTFPNKILDNCRISVFQNMTESCYYSLCFLLVALLLSFQ